MKCIANVSPGYRKTAVGSMACFLRTLGVPDVRFGLGVRLGNEPQFRRWTTAHVGKLFSRDGQCIYLDCAMFALMLALSRLPEEPAIFGMWFPLFLPDKVGTTNGPPDACRALWASGRIPPFSVSCSDLWWPGPEVACFGYDPAIAYDPARDGLESQWVCRVADDLYAGLCRDGVHFLTRAAWHAKVTAANSGTRPQFVSYI